MSETREAVKDGARIMAWGFVLGVCASWLVAKGNPIVVRRREEAGGQEQGERTPYSPPGFTPWEPPPPMGGNGEGAGPVDPVESAAELLDRMAEKEVREQAVRDGSWGSWMET